MGESDAADARPHISVVIATYNRPDDVRMCLEHLARVTYPRWDVTLVDQSEDERTQAVAKTFAARLPTLRYRHAHLKGACRARNLGAAESAGEIIAFTDDDCAVPPDWLTQIAAFFARRPGAMLAFGCLTVPARHGDREWAPDGWTPSVVYNEEKEYTVVGGDRRGHPVTRTHGMGASMYLRRALLRHIGPLDVHFGPGARFLAAEESDYAHRAIAAGQGVFTTPELVVEHHGFRAYEGGAAARQYRTYAYGQGAYLMKMLRLGELTTLAWMRSDLWEYARHANLSNLLLRRGNTGLANIVMYTRGLCASFRLRVDRRRRLYTAWSSSRPRHL